MPRVGIGDRKTSNDNSKHSVLAQLPRTSESPGNGAKYETQTPSNFENIHSRRQTKNLATNSSLGKYISIRSESNAHNTSKQLKITGKTNVNQTTDHSSCWVNVLQKVTYENWVTMDTNEVVSECGYSSVGRTTLHCRCSPSDKRQSNKKQSERGGQTCRNVELHGKDDEKQLFNEELCTRCQSTDVYRPDAAHNTESDDGIIMKMTTYATFVEKRCRCCGGCTNEPDTYCPVISDTISSTIHRVDDHHQNITHMPSNCVGCVEQNVFIRERRIDETIPKKSTNSVDEHSLFTVKSTEEDTLNSGTEHKLLKDKARKKKANSQRNQKHEGTLDVGQPEELTNRYEELGSQPKMDEITSIEKLDRDEKRKPMIKMYNTQMTSAAKSKTIRWKVGQKLTINKTNKSEQTTRNKVVGQKNKDKTMKTTQEISKNRQQLKYKEDKLTQYSRKDDKHTATPIDNVIKNVQKIAKVTRLEVGEHLRKKTDQQANLLESIKLSRVIKPDKMELERVSQLNHEQSPLQQRHQHGPNPAPGSAGSQSVTCDLLAISIIDSATLSWPVQTTKTDERRGFTDHVKEMQNGTPAPDLSGTSSLIGLYWQRQSGSGNLVALESTAKETAKNICDHSETIELQQPPTITQSESPTPQTGVTDCAMSRVSELRLTIPLTCSEFFVPLQSRIEFFAEFLQMNVLTTGTGTKSVSPSSFVGFIVTQPVLRSFSTHESVKEGKASSYLEESTVNGNLISDGRHADNSLSSQDVHPTFDEISPIVDLSVRQSKHQRASSVCLPLPDMFGTKLHAARHSKSSVSSHFPDDRRSKKSQGKLFTTGPIRTSVSSFGESAGVSNRDREMTHSKNHSQRLPKVQISTSSLSGTKREMDLKEKKSELHNRMPDILITDAPTEEVLDFRNQNEESTTHLLADAIIDTESNSKKSVNSVGSETNRLKFKRINTRRLWNVPLGAYARYSLRAKRKILAALRRAGNVTKRPKISKTDKRNASHLKPETRCTNPSEYTLPTHEASSEMAVAGGEPNLLECSDGNQHEEDKIAQKYVVPQTNDDGGDGTQELVASCKIHDTTKPVTPIAETVETLRLEPETRRTTPNGYNLSTHESSSEMAVVGEEPNILGLPCEAYINGCADEKINTRLGTKDYCANSSRLDNLEMIFVKKDGKVLASYWGLRSRIPDDKNVSVNKTEVYTTESIWKDKLDLIDSHINKILLPSNEEAIQNGGRTDQSKSNVDRIAEIVKMGSFHKSVNERQGAFREAFPDAHTSAMQLLIKGPVPVTNTGFTDVLIKKSNKQQVVSREPTSSSNKQTNLPKMCAELSPTLHSTERALSAGSSMEFDDHLREGSLNQREMPEDKHIEPKSNPKDSQTGTVASKNELEHCLFRPLLEPVRTQDLSALNIHSQKRNMSNTPQVTSPPSVPVESSASLRKSYKREYQALSKTTKQLDPTVLDKPYSQRAVCHHLLISSNFGRCNQCAISSPYQRLTQNTCMTPTNLDISLHMYSEETLSDEIGCEVNNQPEKHDTLNSKFGLSHSGYPSTFSKNIVTSSCMSPSLSNPETPETRQSPTTTSVHETDGLSVSIREALLKSTSNSPGRGGSFIWNGSLCSSPGLPAVTCGSPYCNSVAFELSMPNDYNLSDLSETHHRSGEKQPQSYVYYEGVEYDTTGKRIDALSYTGCGATCKKMHKYQSKDCRNCSHHRTCCHEKPHHCPCLEPLTYPASGCACRRACSLMRVKATNKCACPRELLCKPHCAHIERRTKRAASRICCAPYVCSRSPALRFLPALCASQNRCTCYQRCRATSECTAHKLVSTAQLKQTSRAESNSYENDEPESHWTTNIAMEVKQRPSGRLPALSKVYIPPTVSAEQMTITGYDSTVKRDKNTRSYSTYRCNRITE